MEFTVKDRMRKTIHASASMLKNAPKIPQWYIDQEKKKYFKKGGTITKLHPQEITLTSNPYCKHVSSILVDFELW